MAKRYIGDAVITIEYVGETPDGRGNYAGTVRVGKHTWRFDELHSGVVGGGDSPEAYDDMAQSAVSFGSYYSTGNRGEAPEWAPPPEVADAIEEAVGWAQDDRGDYEVRRSPKGKAHEEAVMHEVPLSETRPRPSSAPNGRNVEWEVLVPDGRVIAHITAPDSKSAHTDLIRGQAGGWYPKDAELGPMRGTTRRPRHPMSGPPLRPAPAPTRSTDNKTHEVDMARKKRTPEEADRKRGSDYAVEQISSAYFQDWVWEQMVEAERMRQSDPSSVLPIETKAHALKIARNMFQQLTWDTKREVSESKEFFEGFEEMLDSQKEWLAEMVLDFNREAREKTAPEAREVKHTPTSTMYQEAQVFINGRFQVGFTFTPSRGPEAAAREVLSLTRDGDTIEVKQGQEVWTYKVTGKGIAKRLVTVRETREAYGRRGHRGGGNDRYKQ